MQRALLGVLVLLSSISCTKSIITVSEPFLVSEVRTRPSVRVTAAGVVPAQVHVDHPSTITFTNDDASAHLLEAAPELGYGTCAEMSRLGPLAPGQSGTVTIEGGGVICAFHDAAAPGNRAFQGFLVVH